MTPLPSVVTARQEALAGLSRRAVDLDDLEGFFAHAAATLASVLEAERVAVVERDPGGELVRRVTIGPELDGDLRATQAALDEGAPVVDRNTVTTVTLPMSGEGPGAGAVTIAAARDWDEGDLVLAQAVTCQLAAVIDRSRTRDALERSSARLRAVVDATPAAIYLKDRDGRLVLVNRHFEALFGLPSGDGIGSLNVDLVGPEAGAELSENDRRVLEAGRVMEFEERIPVGGEERVFISLKFPLYDSVPEPVGVGGVSTEITERLRMEARLAQAERLESVGLLAGGIAHDFNNLLAVMMTYAEFVAGAAPEDSRIAEDIDQVRRAAGQAADLTRRLLLFSRRQPSRPEVVDLGEVIGQTQVLLRRTLGEHVEVDVEVEPGLWPVKADRGQLEQVLMNLAINARDAMPDGGHVQVQARNVVLPASREGLAGEAVCVTVRDTGAGMPPEVAAHAFEPFYSTKPAGHGTGLGLSTVYGIVTEAGGTVELCSTPGRGTTAEVHLPAHREAASAPPPATPAAPGGAGERVLLVEDKEAVRVLATRILEDAGYAVVGASDGQDALERAQATGFDVLVTDVVMPRLSGPETAARLRETRPGLPVVLVSGYAEDAAVQGARRGGPTAFVEKPFAAADLLAAVRGTLDAARTS